jgi:hypothetical protein
MEHLVRVRGGRDRKTLAWLREHAGDAAIGAAAQRYDRPGKPYLSTLCRMLGVSEPRFSVPRRQLGSEVAEQSLTAIRQILASRDSQTRRNAATLT